MIKVDPTLLQEVAALTQANDHTAARVLLAREALQNERLARVYKHIGEIAALLGHLPHELNDFRYGLDKQELKKGLAAKGLLEYWSAL